MLGRGNRRAREGGLFRRWTTRVDGPSPMGRWENWEGGVLRVYSGGGPTGRRSQGGD